MARKSASQRTGLGKALDMLSKMIPPLHECTKRIVSQALRHNLFENHEVRVFEKTASGKAPKINVRVNSIHFVSVDVEITFCPFCGKNLKEA